MNYEQGLLYLEQIQNQGIKFGLDNVRILLSALGKPHECLPSVVVAGTNGKGSVCAMLSRILSLHGFRTGLYTSPHLVRVEERIRINGRPISKRDFSRALTLVRDRIDSLINAGRLISPPTYFEILTCLALFHFQTREVDMAVLEVGMGGRYDATNVVRPVLSVITTISLEHQSYLGDTTARIAFEKAGIIKPKIPVVCSVEDEAAAAVIRARALELGAPFHPTLGRGRNLKSLRRGRAFLYTTDSETYTVNPALRGLHQGKNAAAAITAAECLSGRWRPLSKPLIVKGIETVRWPGRMEVVSRDPLVLIDGAHNPEGAEMFRDYARIHAPSPRILVFAVMRDKDIPTLADILFPLADKIVLTRFPYYRAADPQDIQKQASRYRSRIILEPDVSRAVASAQKLAGKNGSVLVAGSLFLVGEMKKHFSPAA